MPKNVIEIFARGNQELFHSAFLAWLMDDQADHGLGKQFRAELLRQLPPELGYEPEGEYSVHTEYQVGNNRFDILLKPNSDRSLKNGLVLENKIKSFGHYSQANNYSQLGYDVAFLALLPQTISEDTRNHFITINYRFICNTLGNCLLDKENWHQRLVQEYKEFLNAKLTVYESLYEYCLGNIDFSTYATKVALSAGTSDFGDNDIRTVNYYYYHVLRDYIRSNAPDLCFGTAGYDEASKNIVNTNWMIEKNMRGAPFMEALSFQPFDTPPWSLHTEFKDMHERESIVIAPRLEVWLDPRGLAMWLKANEAENVALTAERDMGLQATIMLGTWNAEMRAALRRHPYQEVLNLRPRATRNFHAEFVSMADLPFATMTARIREMMLKVFDRAEKNEPSAQAS
ncbi:PD-(D/E)XK nuclease family protein [Microvirga aerilata]|uniref:PD-(D/E)XK nuclease family protein n=1 Tax=Microvirga aerilata TaxID=670292 RepID=A0A937CZB4_9HYPH|nr:PD-(D/E)XK nuclease family protein [Microvirga aerilata]MBL0403832.1 PD-(D/E)XK nuclease family protein [Microvirga aerilata]